MLRLPILLAAAALAAAPASAAPKPAIASLRTAAAAAPVPARPSLRADLTVNRDTLSLADLVEGLSGAETAAAAFRAPALGETGTIQVSRILEAAQGRGLLRDPAELETHGLAQVIVTRAARKLGAAEIEAAIRVALAERHNVDARPMMLVMDGASPVVAVEPELTGELTAPEISYDARARRVSARLMVPGSASMRLKPVRITGQMVETVEVVVPARAIGRGDTLAAGDVLVERRPRDAVAGTDLIADLAAAVGKVARRPLMAGLPLRANDVQRQEIVAKGDVVNIVYEVPGVLLSLRGKAMEAGAIGDTVAVVNPQSKRTLQAVVTGPGQVKVGPVTAGRIASAP